VPADLVRIAIERHPDGGVPELNSSNLLRLGNNDAFLQQARQL